MIIFKNRVEREVVLRFLFLVSVVLLSAVIIFTVPGMLWQALLAIVGAYLFYPLINRMETWGMKRWLSILIVYAVVGGGVFVVYQTSYTGIITQFENFSDEAPRIFDRILFNIKGLEDKYSQTYVLLSDLRIAERLQDYGFEFAHGMVQAAPKLISMFIAFIVLVPLYMFFLLKDAKSINKWILDMLPNRYLETGVKLLFNINRQMEGFIQARLLEAGVLGLIVYVGFLILGIKYALLLSLFAAVMNLVPYLGMILGSIPGIAVAYFYGDSSALVWYTVLVYTIAQLADIILIIPLVFSKRINIHPMVVIILLIIGFSVMGILGMILAVPFFCILKALFNAVSARITVSQ